MLGPARGLWLALPYQHGTPTDTMLNAMLSFAGWEAAISDRVLPGPALQPRLSRDLAAASDEALLAWAGEGDRMAFDQLALRHLGRLHQVALRITGRPAEAEEAVQDAMLSAWRNATRFDPARARAGTWLYSITAHAAIDRARRPAPMPLEAAGDPPDPAADPESRLAERQRQEQLQAAMADLPPRQRAALALAYDQGLSGAEAAAALSVSLRGLEGLLRRARGLLAARLRGTPE